MLWPRNAAFPPSQHRAMLSAPCSLVWNPAPPPSLPGAPGFRASVVHDTDVTRYWTLNTNSNSMTLQCSRSDMGRTWNRASPVASSTRMQPHDQMSHGYVQPSPRMTCKACTAHRVGTSLRTSSRAALHPISNSVHPAETFPDIQWCLPLAPCSAAC
jgi:hypothetical protein